MKYLILTISALFLFTACSDDDHPAHYASDYTTFVYTLDALSWNEYTDAPGYFATINAPEITYDILDYGYFLTYLNIGSERDPNYIELPQTQVYTDENGITYSIEIVPSYSFETVTIEYFDTHPDGVIFPQIDYSFRTVIISEPYIINGIKSGEINTDYESVVNEMQNNNIEVNTIDYQ